MDIPKQYVPFVAAGVVALAGFFLGDWSLMAWLLAATIACTGIILEDTRWGVFATAVLGLGCSAYLFNEKLSAGGGPSLCDINEVISCNTVNSSAASELFGIPIALLGSGFFLGVAIAALVSREASARLFTTVALLGGVGVLYSLYLAFEAAQLGAVCVMCITIYLCNGLLTWAGWRGVTQAGEELQQNVSHVPTSNSFVAISATFAVVVLIGLSTWSGQDEGPSLPEITGEREDPESAPGGTAATDDGPKEGNEPASKTADAELMKQLSMMFSYPSGTVELAGDEPVLGDPSAPYLVVEYADFGCPHCAHASSLLKQLVQQVPEIQVRFRPFPLSGACNPVLESKERVDRCRAAMAAECANQQGRFWDYATELFSKQSDLSDARLAQVTRELGLDGAAWQSCMQDQQTVRSIAASAVAGDRAGVKGTPALYVRGLTDDRWVEVCMGPEAILALVDAHQKGLKLPAPEKATCF